MRRFLRAHLGTFAVAFVTAALVAGGPAMAGTITNADKVDGFSAVGCQKPAFARAHVLVATCSSGRLPSNIIRKAPNSDELDGKDSSDFYAAGSKVVDSELLDGVDATGFYSAGSKVVDSELLDGKDSSAFLGTGAKAADSDKLDGKDSTEFLVATGSQSRNATCAGSGFLPVDDGLAYGTDASLRFSQTAGGVFRCSASLPDGASVTAVRFSVEDSVAANIGPCRMVRTSLVSSIGAETVMADAGSTSGTPGGTRLSDTSVASPNIDNANFAYFLTCTIGGTDNQVGVYGASIAYTISNAAG